MTERSAATTTASDFMPCPDSGADQDTSADKPQQRDPSELREHNVAGDDLQPYLDTGYALLPLHPWDYLDALGRPRGKSPLFNDWPQRKPCESNVLMDLISGGHNVGVLLRHQDVVIDIDPRNQACSSDHDPVKDMFAIEIFDEHGNRSWSCRKCGHVGMSPEEMATAGGIDLSPYARVHTGGGGLHAYAVKDPAVRIRERCPEMQGIEFKTRGRQVVAAGSRHPNGNYYRWDDQSPSLGFTGSLCEVVLSAIVRPGVGDLEQRAPGEINPEQAARLLAQLDPRDYSDYQDWLNLGFAVFHATNGLAVEEWVEWSTSDEDYAGHEVVIRERWSSFEALPGEPARTLATLLWEVREAFGSSAFLDQDMLPDLEFEPPPLAPGERAGPPLHPLDQFNLEFAHVHEGSKDFVYMLNEEGIWKRTNVESFKRLVAHRMMENPNWDPDGDARAAEFIQVAPTWLKSARRHLYLSGMKFAPSGCPPGFFNTWMGFSLEPGDGEWSMYHELVYDVICDGNPEYAEYWMRWHAYMLQYPGAPAEVALVLRSGMGYGKNSVAEPFIRMFGSNSFLMSHGVGNHFNAHLERIIFLVASESFFAGDKAGRSQLKTMITERGLMFEPKGVDAYMGNNCLHIMLFSNDEWVIPAGIDERRFAMFEIVRKMPFEWWDRYHAQMTTGDGSAGLMKYMLEMDLGDWHPRRGVPQTSALTRQKLHSLDPAPMWYLAFLRRGKPINPLLPDGADEAPSWADGSVMMQLDGLKDNFACSLGSGPGKARRVEMELAAMLRKYCPAHKRERMRVDGERSRYVKFPSLDECRAAFEAAIGGSVDWDE